MFNSSLIKVTKLAHTTKKSNRGRPCISQEKQEIMMRLRARTNLTLQQIAEYVAVSCLTVFKYTDHIRNPRRTCGSLTTNRRNGVLIAKSRVRRLVTV
jgi:hypothetical protein